MGSKYVGVDNLDCIKLIQDRVCRQALILLMLNFCVPVIQW
jgi:hypothetical protein